MRGTSMQSISSRSTTRRAHRKGVHLSETVIDYLMVKLLQALRTIIIYLMVKLFLLKLFVRLTAPAALAMLQTRPPASRRRPQR